MSKSTSSKADMSGKEEERKSASSSSQPPAKPGKSLLATDDGEDVGLLVTTQSDTEDLDLLERDDMPRSKPRNSFSLRFFGGSSKKQPKKNKMNGRGSFIGFLLPKTAKNTYDSMNGTQDDGSRVDSIVWRRKESKEMTKSLQMDADIYQYLKERSPSFEEEERNDDVPVPAVTHHKPPKVKKRKNKKNKKEDIEIRSNLLVTEEGGTRQATAAPHVEMKRRKGLFSKIGRFFKRKEGSPSFMSKVRSSFRFRSSYNATNADDLRMQLAEKEKDMKVEETEGLFRKDSDETDLSDDIDFDSNLLVSETEEDKQNGLVANEGVRESQILDEHDEEVMKPQTGTTAKKESFLGTNVTKSSQDLKVVKAKGSRNSDEIIKKEAETNRVEKAFALSPAQDKKLMRSVSTEDLLLED